MVADVVGTAKSYFYTISVALVILLVGLALGILAKKFLYRLFKEVELNRFLGKFKIKRDMETAISSIISYLIYIITIYLFFGQLGIRAIVIYVILSVILLLIILTFLVEIKDIIPNFRGGLHLRGKLKIGGKIEFEEIIGTIEKIGYLETIIKTKQGDLLYIPNSLLLKAKY